jgi:hypothetical protein
MRVACSGLPDSNWPQLQHPTDAALWRSEDAFALQNKCSKDLKAKETPSKFTISLFKTFRLSTYLKPAPSQLQKVPTENMNNRQNNHY